MADVVRQGQLTLARLTKRYATTTAVDAIDLDVGRGEFLTLLGPSGSGKTTTLMMVAGFTPPSEGEILVDDRPITGMAPEHRNIGVVFQNYALFPHMKVFDNVAFPLKMRGRPQAEIRAQVGRSLDMVHLTGLGDRLPRQLSGGQQQRVALARALVFDPGLLLMDEPLGALDRNLREQMKLEIKRIHSDVGVTVLYVTHDQEEALTMSDRIALDEPGPDRPARHGRGSLRAAGQSFRGELHRRIESARRPCRVLAWWRRLCARWGRAASRVARSAGVPAGRVMHPHGAAGEDRSWT